MPPLIADRPRTWNEVVGQERVLRVLQALLRSPGFLTRGLIFEGPFAVGKTTCAYLFARALMCLGDDPLGCGRCVSCRIADTDGLENHPNFREIDGANFRDVEGKRSSVDAVRDLLGTLDTHPLTARRTVVVLDEAHRLSPQAWDVFLKPLERPDTDVVFLFVTSEGHQIPQSITSRCAVLRFGKVDPEALLGMLMARADEAGIRYRSDGLRAIARFAQGRPRDAVKGLSLAAAMGEITPETVGTALNFQADLLALDIFALLLADDVVGAVGKADLLAASIGPAKTIEEMFSAFAQDAFTTHTLTPGFAAIKDMSAFFLRWSATANLSADVIPLFVLDLSELRSSKLRSPDTVRGPTRFAHRGSGRGSGRGAGRGSGRGDMHPDDNDDDMDPEAFAAFLEN